MFSKTGSYLLYQLIVISPQSPNILKIVITSAQVVPKAMRTGQLRPDQREAVGRQDFVDGLEIGRAA